MHLAERERETDAAYDFDDQERKIFSRERTREKTYVENERRISFERKREATRNSPPTDWPSSFRPIQFEKGNPLGTRISLHGTSCN